MASTKQLLGLALIAAAVPLAPAAGEDRPSYAPAGTAETRYCMRVAAITGSKIERVRCWTRDHWAEQGVDVDKDWPTEGVRTID